jgi:hypothetical protein
MQPSGQVSHSFANDPQFVLVTPVMQEVPFMQPQHWPFMHPPVFEVSVQLV